MKSRRPIATGLIAVALLLLLSGVTSLFWGSIQGPGGLVRGSRAEPSAAMFVPKRSPLMLSLVVNPNRLSGGGWLPGPGKRARAELRSLRDGLLAPAGLDYRKDLRPWIGDEVTLAVTDLDLDREGDNGRQPGYLLALATRRPQRAREFLQLYWQRRAADGTRLAFEQVSGARMVFVDSPSAPLETSDDSSPARQSVATALVGDRYVLFANDPKVLRSAINHVQVPELNLLNAPRYRRALEALTGPRLAVGFANFQTLGSWIVDQGLTVSKTPLPSQPAGLYDAVALGLGTTRSGVLADVALLKRDAASRLEIPAESEQGAGDSPMVGPDTRPDTRPDTVRPTDLPTVRPTDPPTDPRAALKYLPSNTAIAASSDHLDQFWQGTQRVLKAYPAIATVVNRAIGHLESDWDVNFTQEIFPWVQGAYALGELERPQGPSDWVFVVERTRPEAQAGIAHLDDLARQQGYSIGTLTLADRPVTAWTKLKPEGQQDSADKALRALVRGVHGPVGPTAVETPDKDSADVATNNQYEVFATSLEAMEAVLQASGDQALANSQGFRAAIAPLPKTNQGYLHLNWAESEATLSQQVPFIQVLKLTAEPLFRHLQSITLSGYPATEETQRTAIALRWGR